MEFVFNIPNVYLSLIQLNVFNMAQYDAFMLYAHALNDTITAGEDPRNGSNVIKRMWNRTFPGKFLAASDKI